MIKVDRVIESLKKLSPLRLALVAQAQELGPEVDVGGMKEFQRHVGPSIRATAMTKAHGQRSVTSRDYNRGR
jgi:hypothetical protein